MTIRFNNACIPGTKMNKAAMGNVTGEEFLDKIFYIQHGIMLSNIRDISGIDGSTLQNWVKRGWTGNAVNKKYTKDQLARILLINMMRSAIQLERIDTLLHYINGDLDRTDDDIIPESKLFDYVCRAVDAVSGNEISDRSALEEKIAGMTADFPEAFPGARKRLNDVIAVVVTAYASSVLTEEANNALASMLEAGK